MSYSTTTIAYSDVGGLILGLDDDVSMNSTSDGGEQHIIVLHDALKLSLKSITEYSFNGFICQGTWSGIWNCFPAVV